MEDEKQHPSDCNGSEDAESFLASDDAYITYLSPEAFDKLLEMLDNPKPPSKALIELMKRHSLWNKD